jgi:hypothetical protein
MPHQLQAESLRPGQSVGKSDSIIADREQKFGRGHPQSNRNSLRSSVLDRVGYRFLSDPIQLSCNYGVGDSN